MAYPQNRFGSFHRSPLSGNRWGTNQYRNPTPGLPANQYANPIPTAPGQGQLETMGMAPTQPSVPFEGAGGNPLMQSPFAPQVASPNTGPYQQMPMQTNPGLYPASSGFNVGNLNYLTNPLMAGYFGVQNPLYGTPQAPQDFYGVPPIGGGS